MLRAASTSGEVLTTSENDAGATGPVRALEAARIELAELRRSLSEATQAKERAEHELSLSEERYHVLTEELSMGVLIQGPNAEIILSNPKALELLGLSEDQLHGRTSFDPTWNVIHEDGSDFPGPTHPVPRSIASRQSVQNVIMGVFRPVTQDRVWLLVNADPKLNTDGTVRQVVCTFADVTERRRAEENYQTLFREMLDGFALHEMLYDNHGQPVNYRFLAANPAFERMTGLKADAIVGKTVLDVLPNAETKWIETYGKVVVTGEPACFESYSTALSKHFQVTAFRPRPHQFACVITDITEQRLAEKRRAELEDRLHLAAKMESVGRLAGGVAHDFNNMLGVILGHAELALETLDETLPTHVDLLEIKKAAERSASLTRQLLAFARKQTATPRLLELNETVAGMLKMLQRLIGENLRIDWVPSEGLWPVKVDPSQIDQILANLCTNARDAITGFGKITIETANSTVDEEACASRSDAVPGDYVRLSVSDNGSGMDEETLKHIFEPFFTTKEVGQGTGLGMATVYGIVRQNQGFIDASSQPGHGTTFRLYFPRFSGDGEIQAERSHAPPALRGHETILVAEDEPSMLNIIKMSLERLGYPVLAASSPSEALRLAGEHSGAIDLLLTDVLMPDMNGRELANLLLASYPQLRCVYMSGYTADVIAQQGVLEDGVPFLQKPFSREDLAIKVRSVLNRKSEA